MMLNFAEMTNFESSETGTYPLSALLSDLGGAAGLWFVSYLFSYLKNILM